MRIRNMNHSDIDFAFHCTNSEGWASETKESFEAFLSFDRDGCFIAEHDNQNIGLCLAIKYKHSGFIGELIVIPEMRGKGFGSKLFNHSIEYLKSAGISNIYLDGDLEAVPIYEKAGYRKICKSLRFVGKLKGQEHTHVRKTSKDDLSKICDIDNDLFGEDRSFFLKHYFGLFPDFSFVLGIDNKIYGYIFARPGVDVISVGPFAALPCDINPVVLLERLALAIGNKVLRIGILDKNTKAVGLIKSLGSFEEKVPCWRMVLGQSENLGLNENLYAIGSAAKG